MSETIQLGDIAIEVTRKISQACAPVRTPAERPGDARRTCWNAARSGAGLTPSASSAGFGSSSRGFVDKRGKRRAKFIERETHDLWGRRHLLTVRYQEAKPSVTLDHRRITLTVRPHASTAKRAEVMHEWHKSLLHEVIPALIRKWEPKLRVKVRGYFLQRMKTKWGSCNHRAGHIRLNTELVKKPRTCWSTSLSTRCFIWSSQRIVNGSSAF